MHDKLRWMDSIKISRLFITLGKFNWNRFCDTFRLNQIYHVKIHLKPCFCFSSYSINSINITNCFIRDIIDYVYYYCPCPHNTQWLQWNGVVRCFIYYHIAIFLSYFPLYALDWFPYCNLSLSYNRIHLFILGW